MTSRRVRRRRRQVFLGTLVLLGLVIVLATSGGSTPPHATTTTTTGSSEGNSPTTSATSKSATLSPTWRGDQKPVTIAFGGDIHFQGHLQTLLTKDPKTALGPTINKLRGGANITMADFESTLTDGTCPTPQRNTTVFDAPSTAITAFFGAGLSLVSMANGHGEDCGPTGLGKSIAIATSDHFPIIGIGKDAAQAYAPYTKTITGQRIAIFAATQVFPPTDTSEWTATTKSPGLASAVGTGEAELINAIEAARKVSDTVVVYVFWGTTADNCPNTSQKLLASQLVKAGADIVVGSGAHVLQGSGYLGQSYVDYGLGNLAFYDSKTPETTTGMLFVTITGRHVDKVTWRPAFLTGFLPTLPAGSQAASLLSTWTALRTSCPTSLVAKPAAALATASSEITPGTVSLPTTPSSTAPVVTTTRVHHAS